MSLNKLISDKESEIREEVNLWATGLNLEPWQEIKVSLILSKKPSYRCSAKDRAKVLTRGTMRKVVSIEISRTEWSQLIGSCPVRLKYILRALRLSNNKPVDYSTLNETRPVDQRFGAPHTDTGDLNTWFTASKLDYSIRKVEGHRYGQGKVQLCKVEPNIKSPRP